MDVLEAIIRAKDEATATFKSVAKVSEETKRQLEGMGASAKGATPSLAELERRINALDAPIKSLGDDIKKLPKDALSEFGKELTQSFNKMADSLGPAGVFLKALGPELVAVGGAATIAAGVFKSWASDLLATAGQIKDLEMQSGAGAEAIQRWGYAFEQAGLKGASAAKAIQTVSERVGDGNEKLASGVRTIGLSLDQLRAMQPEEQFRAIVQGLGQMHDASLQAAAAKDIFGTGWREVLRAVRDGALETAAAADQVGVVLGGKTVDGADKLGDAMNTLGRQWETLKASFVSGVLSQPEVLGFFESLTGLLAKAIPLAGDLANKMAMVGKAVLVPTTLIKSMAGETGANDARSAEFSASAAQNAAVLGARERVAAAAAQAQADIEKLNAALVKGLEQGRREQEAAAKRLAEQLKRDAERINDIFKHMAGAFKKADAAADKKAAVDAVTTALREQLATQQALAAAEQQRGSAYVADATMQAALAKQSIIDLKAGADAAESFRKAQIKAIDELIAANPTQRKALEDIKAGLTGAKEQTFDFVRALDSLRNIFQTLGIDANNALAKIVAGLSAGLAAMQQFKEASKLKGSDRALGMASAGLQAGAAAYGSGSVLGGAASGAMAGAAFGVPGAMVGGIAGGILGLFGGKAKVKKELADLRAQLLQSVGGSMEELRKKAAALGVDISKAFTTKNPAELKRIMDQLNKAAEEQKKRWEGVQTALGGLELRTKGFADHMAQVGTVLAKDEDSFQRLGRYAVATFGAYVRETGDVIGALRAMEGSLGSLSDLQAKFGFVGGAAITQLLGMRDVLNANQGVADSLQGLNQLMQGLADQGGITRALFQDFGTDAGAIFQQLIAGGADSNTAMALMQPTLQRLWEAQKKYGAVTDETTASLLKQAEEQGLVGENMRSVNEQILTVLVAIGEALGATIPDALRRMGATAVNEFDRAGDAAERFGSRMPDLPTGGSGDAGYFNGGEPNPGSLPGFAVGGTVTRPTVARVGENGTEHILTPAQLQSYMATAMQAAGGAGGTVVVKVYLDGREISARVERGMERGEIAPARGRLKVRA